MNEPIGAMCPLGIVCRPIDRYLPIMKMDARPSVHCELRHTIYALLGQAGRPIIGLDEEVGKQSVPEDAFMYFSHG